MLSGLRQKVVVQPGGINEVERFIRQERDAWES